jgi:hypothetical protein
LLDAIVEAMRRTFLTKTARTQGQSIMYFRDPFKFVPIGGDGGIADIADKFSRNEITSSNEIRQAIGMKPRRRIRRPTSSSTPTCPRVTLGFLFLVRIRTLQTRLILR